MRGRFVGIPLSRPVRRLWTSVLMFASTVTGGLTFNLDFAEAQQPRTFRATPVSFERDTLDELGNQIFNSERQRFDSLRENSLRTYPNSPNLRTPTPELEKVRPLLSDATNEATALVVSLNDDMRRYPSVRPLLTDAMRLKAQAKILADDSLKVNDHRLLTDQLQELETGWMSLAYQLSRSRELSTRTQDSVRSINELARLMQQILQLEPQLDRWGLLSQVAQLSADIEHLNDDIEYEMYNSPDAQQILLATKRVQQQAYMLTRLLQDDADRPAVIDAYKRFQTLWYPQAAKLQAMNNSILERSLRRVTDSDGQIAQLLLLQQDVNKDQLVYLTSQLRNAIDTFDKSVSLREVTRLPNPRLALSTVDQFYGVCDNFIDNVQRNERQEVLVDAFRYIEDGRRDFVAVFRASSSPEAQASLRQIEQTLNTLATSMQVSRSDFDRTKAMSLAANVANLADQLDYTTQRWISRERPPFGNAALRETAAFADGSVRLQQMLARGATASQMQQEVTNLYENWRRVYNHIVNCQTEERRSLGQLSSQITPAMVELRTMVSSQF